eukprot:c25174_g1_i1 orf=440-1876(-)
MEMALLPFVGSFLGFLAFIQAVLPPQIGDVLHGFLQFLSDYLFPYDSFDIPEQDGVRSNPLYQSVKLHLSVSQNVCNNAKHVIVTPPKANDDDEIPNDVQYSLANNVPIKEIFKGVPLWWEHRVEERKQQAITLMGRGNEDKRYYILKVHRRNRAVVRQYLKDVMWHSQEILNSRKEKKIYTNFSEWDEWKSVPFKHPSTFSTLAMDPAKKEEIMNDLRAFMRAETFYSHVGRAWKRGYLLYGPPGTGKSSLIAAMANFMGYDLYDLELTDVKSNVKLRQLLIETTNRSIIVIEDLDSPLQLVQERSKRNQEEEENDSEDKNPLVKEKKENNRVTLSGILNFTDGLWSSLGRERIIVFTTNHIDKIDRALLRSGRMDMHICMSYCSFPAFKILASNYLGVDDHILYEEVEKHIDGAEITPADVSEVLIKNRHDPTTAVERVIEAIKAAKEKMRTDGSCREGEGEGERDANEGMRESVS